MLKLQNLIVLLSICLLTACGGEAIVKPDTAKPDTTSTAPSKQSGSKAGGYYLDDGPGDNPPANIDAIPDATLKTEAPLVRSNKPYSALGQQYTPMTSYSPYKQSGIASWYGKRYHGKKTSSGEVYDMYGMSGAHTTLPIPSYARVTNPANGRSVIVRINDRGPFKHDRLIDLSYAAAYKLRLTGQGSGLVEVEAIDTSPAALAKLQNQTATQAQSPAQPKPQTPVAADTPAQAVQSVPLNMSKTSSATTELAGNYYVQAGAFKSEGNGDLLQKKIQALQLAENVGIANVYNNGLYRVKLGPYASRKEADTSAANIRKQLNISAIVLNQ
jgi:rare lipoprotein A